LGQYAGQNLTTGDNNIYIGNFGVAAESNTIRIGFPEAVTNEDHFPVQAHAATFIAGINGAIVTGAAVMIDATTGQLGTVVSSQRFKDEIKPMDKASEAILLLKPVTFRYKHELDPKAIPQFGLVAEEVEKVNPDLVVREANGKVYSVRYEAVNAMLLNEFLKQHRKVEELEATVAQQQKDFRSTSAQQQKDYQAIATHQQKQIETLTAGLQKVSAQIELSKPAPQVAVNNQ
jgi:hypothetical protein